MLICTECGTRNEDDERFCGECGAYLEWEGERVEPRPTTAPVTTTPSTTAGTTPSTSSGTRSSARAATTGSVDKPSPAPGPTGGPITGDPRPAEPLSPPRPPGPAAGAAAPASDTVGPGPHPDPTTAAPTGTGTGGTGASGTDDGDPSPGQPQAPAAVRPGAAAPRRRTTRRPEPEEAPPAPGDLICGQCGTGNVPARKFCRRCGVDLVDAPVQPAPPWWRRPLPRRAPRLAGARPRRRRFRFPTRLVALLAVLGLVGGAAWWFRGPLGTGYDMVRDRLADNPVVTPVGWAASSAAPDRGPELAGDGTTNRSWAPASPGDAAGEFLEAHFDAPFRLVYLRVFSGASEQQPEFLANGRPDALAVTLTRADDGQETTQVRLDDRSGDQVFTLGVDDVVAVRLTVVSAHPVPPGAHLAVGEVEFLGRSQ